MAAGGSLAATGLLWLCLAPAALLRLHQPQPVLVVEPEKPVEIICEANENMESKAKVSWYRHGKDGPRLVVACKSEMSQGFSCKFGGHKVTLHIPCAHPDNTGLYLCAYHRVHSLEFGSGTVLLVGDSWREQSWVRVLAPHGDPRVPPSLVCAVGATCGPVLVSRPGEAGRVLGLGGSVELLISPVGTTQGGGGLCEVRFNASGPVVRRSVELRKAEGSCVTPSSWALAGAVVLLLLSVCLSICRLCRPTEHGDQPETPMPPVSQENEGQLTYAQLTFATPGTAHAMTHSRMR
ncbi:uncharacterized protein LOC128900983 isoform X1 [Rissa tridactyla]|uniref:uncharacterized protein LOC128900983 isoform X1 n=2 Tax=Rissa tridactyla TaxID=75485 RepID=UPI0023BAE431|nr:uncharacterized protein LOC128900983 isoform X1 [Rissa tridactyla]